MQTFARYITPLKDETKTDVYITKLGVIAVKHFEGFIITFNHATGSADKYTNDNITKCVDLLEANKLDKQTFIY
jgi:hypothetical protein